MRDKFLQDYCPYSKDQGFLDVVGDVEQGDTMFGFSVTTTKAVTTVIFDTDTRNEGAGGPQVHEMNGIDYHVFPFCSTESTSAFLPLVLCYVTDKTRLGFTLHGEANFTYDIIVKGRVKS
jgi:hypothetical protein